MTYGMADRNYDIRVCRRVRNARTTLATLAADAIRPKMRVMRASRSSGDAPMVYEIDALEGELDDDGNIAVGAISAVIRVKKSMG